MNREYSTIYKKIKAAVLLLCLFFMMVNTCPIRYLLTTSITQTAERSTQADGSDALVYDSLRCSESEITEASALDFSTLTHSSLPLPLLLTVISLYLSVSVLGLGFKYGLKERKLSFTNPVPLFLQNRSIII